MKKRKTSNPTPGIPRRHPARPEHTTLGELPRFRLGGINQICPHPDGEWLRYKEVDALVSGLTAGQHQDEDEEEDA